MILLHTKLLATAGATGLKLTVLLKDHKDINFISIFNFTII